MASLPNPSISLNNHWATSVHPVASQDVVYCHYPFLTVSNIHGIPHQDVNFLEQQGCFRVPIRPVLDDFLQQYFLHIHSFLPLINEGDFWKLYHTSSNPPKQQLPLFVLQAMLFASCTFVSQSTVDALGFCDIRSMRATFLRRAKLLYNMGTELSPLVIAQAALLLSFTSLSSMKTPNTLWLVVAIENAKLADAHLYAMMTAPSVQKHRSILKRVWWCCIMRDRSIGLLMRRPIHITHEHFDFHACPLVDSDFADEFDRSQVYNPATKRSLAGILAQSVQLYIILTDILLLVFPVNVSLSQPKHTHEDLSRLHNCRDALSRWYTSGFPTVLESQSEDVDRDSIVLYTNLLSMYYHTSKIALCHYEALHLENLQNDSSTEASSMCETRRELQDAASALIKCHKNIAQQGLARWLPIAGIGCTALPLVLDTLNLKLSPANSNDDMDAQHQGNTLVEIMKTYLPRYDGVDWVSEIVRHIVTLVQSMRPKLERSHSTANWTDIFAVQPGSYLRLVLTLDLSLSKGKLPHNSDFPLSLREVLTVDANPLNDLLLDNSSHENHDKPSQREIQLVSDSQSESSSAEESFLDNIEQIYLHLAGTDSGSAFMPL